MPSSVKLTGQKTSLITVTYNSAETWHELISTNAGPFLLYQQFLGVIIGLLQELHLFSQLDMNWESP